jgi:hypothetical protein
MDAFLSRCAGIDVHMANVVACARHADRPSKAFEEVRTSSTMTRDLPAPAGWLAGRGITRVAVESTGVYWKPAFNLPGGRFEVLLVNAEHAKQVPGRKTDVKGCQWIARPLQRGLLKAGFVPPEPTREPRDLTRQRARLAAEKASAANRVQKAPGDADVKLAGVATDVPGTSGRAMPEALVAGVSDAEQPADLARMRLRAKIPRLRLALQGRVTEHHRSLLRLRLDHVSHLEGLIGRLSVHIEEWSCRRAAP